MTYNLTNVTSANDLVGVLKFINADLTGSMFFNLVVFAFWIIVFVAMKRYSVTNALPASLFIAMIITLFLYVLGMVNVFSIYIMVAFFSLSLLTLLKED